MFSNSMFCKKNITPKDFNIDRFSDEEHETVLHDSSRFEEDGRVFIFFFF